MSEFVESDLKFIFGDGWSVIKYDDLRFYREKVEKLDSTKAADFLGTYKNALYFIEVKNFCGHRIENKSKISNGELAIEVAQKLRDSFAAEIGRARAETPDAVANQLISSRTEVKFIFWLEQDAQMPSQRRGKDHFFLANLTETIKQKLKWANVKVLVTNSDAANIPGLTVSRMPITR